MARSSGGRRLLEMQADRIEMVLASHKVAGRVWGGSVAPRFTTFSLAATLGTKIRNIATLSEELAMALGVTQCRIYREEGAIRIEVPRDEAGTVPLCGLCRGLSALPPATAVLGVERSGDVLLANLGSPDVVHILVSGTTGSGKTEVLRSIVASLALLSRQSDCQMLLIDPKSRGLAPFAGLPHLLRRPISAVAEVQPALETVVAEMERRDHTGDCRPRMVIVIDELADLLMQGGAGVEAALTRLVQRGRGAGIHVVAATQKPAASVISTLLRSNFPMRIVGRVVSAQDALIASGIAGSNAERLLGRGDMLAVLQGRTIRFQGAFLSEGEAGRLVQALQRPGPALIGSQPATSRLTGGSTL